MRDIRGLLLGVGAAMALATGAYAQSDSCAGATAVGEGSFPFDTTGFATDQVPACGFNGASDAFWSYTPSATGVATISTCGSVFDTILAVYDACGGNQIVCLDDFCGFQTTVNVSVTQGVPVIIQVSGYNGASGAGTLTITGNFGGAPANDQCANATPVGPGTYNTDTTLATNDGTQSCAAAQTSPDIWFAYTATADGSAQATMCGSGYDTALAVFDTCYGTELACNDDSCGLQSTLTWGVTNGATYIVRVSGFAGNTGPGTITFSQLVPPPNDQCANATPVGEGDFPWDNQAADTDGFDTCGFGGIPGGGDVWFLYTPTFTGTARASACNSSFGDTIMNAFDACGGSEIACNDDFCGLDAGFTLNVTQGVPVLIRVAGWNNQRGTGNLRIEQVTCGVGNDCCATADPVGEGTFNFDTSFATNDGSASCAASASSPDIWFAYTAGASGTASISLCGSGYDTAIAVFDTCYGAELTCNDDSCGLQSATTVSVTQGTTYLIRISGFAGSVGAGTMTIGICNGLEYPAGAALEPEACGDDQNGGCNMPVPTYTPIAMNSAVHGTAWANANFRDTDWYTINLNAGQTITVCGAAEFNFVNYVVTLNPDCNNIQVPGIGGGAPCTTSTITYTAPADGTYIIFVATSDFNGTPCNAGDVGNNYWVSVRDDGTCPQVGGGCAWQSVGCVADFNGSGGTPDDADVSAFFAAWNAGDECADANQSGGTPDDADVSAFFAAWNAGGC